MPTPRRLLEVRDLTVRFGGVLAVDHVDLEVERGELVGVIGPNGAGKTTILEAVSGFEAYEGRITFADAPTEGLSPRQRVKLGMARTFQSLELFEDLTVKGNLLVAAEAGAGGPAPGQRVDRLLGRMGLGAAAGCLPSALPHGQRRLVALARTLATGARLVLVDEPAAGLDRQERDTLGAHLTAFARAGTAVVLVDHDMALVLGVCQRILVLDRGRLIAQGSAAEVRNDVKVITAYLGPRANGATG